MGEGAYQRNLVPVALVGENLFLVPLNRYVVIKYVEPVSIPIIDFGPIAGSASLPLAQLVQTSMPDDEILQIRTKVIDPIQVEIYQKRAVGRFSTRTLLARWTVDTGTINNFEGYNASEMFIYEDEAPWLIVSNPAVAPIVTSRIMIEGFRYVIETLSDVPAKYTAVPIWGWGSRGE